MNSKNPKKLPKKPSRPAKSDFRPRARPQLAQKAPKIEKTKADLDQLLAHPFVVRPQGVLAKERVPLILETSPSEDYALLDSGNGLKLERYGRYQIIRPEAQAIWQPAFGRAVWQQSDAVFTGNTDEEGLGRWFFPKEALEPTWPMKWQSLEFLGRFTSFRHVGVFPEQEAHWLFLRDLILKHPNRRLKVLNLFAYTGVASLIAAQAGAEVTHVDASKRAIGWAQENQKIAKLDRQSIRWICEDAMKFVQREVRRGHHYDIILLDPPAYGRGPQGEVWQLFDHLPAMIESCQALLSKEALSLVLTAYSIRASFYALHTIMRDSLVGKGGLIESGELVLKEQSAGRHLSTSLFSRWVSDAK